MYKRSKSVDLSRYIIILQKGYCCIFYTFQTEQKHHAKARFNESGHSLLKGTSDTGYKSL